MSEKCNICGSELDIWDAQNGLFFIRKMGYGSKYDGDTIDLHICCNCFDKIISKCRIDPVVKNQ